MGFNTKSSITLPAAEFKLVVALKKRLRMKSNVEVIRRGMEFLKASVDREALREGFFKASQATRATHAEEQKELDHLAAEGLDED